MKTTIALSILLLANLVSAHSFVVEGTNVVQIQFQDAALSTAQKEWIGADILRTVTPALSFTSLERYVNKPVPSGYLRRLYVPEDAEGTPTLTSEISISGTNIVLTVDKDYTDCYRSREAFFNTHSNAIAQAFAFANLLVTNPIPVMPDTLLKDIRLSKAYAPGQLPMEHAGDIRRDLGSGIYFPPSLLGFQMLPYGPNGSAQYLWGMLPNRVDNTVDSVPIIYYQNRWWISYWHLEEINQKW